MGPGQGLEPTAGARLGLVRRSPGVPELAEIVVVVAIVSILVVAFVVAALRRPESRARRGLRGPATPVAQAVAGKRLKISGRVRARSAAVATLTGEPSVYSRLAILHFFRSNRGDGAMSESWKPVAQEHAGGEFELVDDSGSVVVDPVGALLLDEPMTIEIDWDRLPPRLAALATQNPRDVEVGLPARGQEHVVREGETLSVWGEIVDVGGGPRMEAADGRLLAIQRD